MFIFYIVHQKILNISLRTTKANVISLVNILKLSKYFLNFVDYLDFIVQTGRPIACCKNGRIFYIYKQKKKITADAFISHNKNSVSTTISQVHCCYFMTYSCLVFSVCIKFTFIQVPFQLQLFDVGSQKSRLNETTEKLK